MGDSNGARSGGLLKLLRFLRGNPPADGDSFQFWADCGPFRAVISVRRRRCTERLFHANAAPLILKNDGRFECAAGKEATCEWGWVELFRLADQSEGQDRAGHKIVLRYYGSTGWWK